VLANVSKIGSLLRIISEVLWDEVWPEKEKRKKVSLVGNAKRRLFAGKFCDMADVPFNFHGIGRLFAGEFCGMIDGVVLHNYYRYIGGGNNYVMMPADDLLVCGRSR
jgi:hypothetical protein